MKGGVNIESINQKYDREKKNNPELVLAFKCPKCAFNTIFEKL